MTRPIRIGSRASKLAMAQTQLVIDLIKKNVPDIELQIVQVKTEGDLDTNSPLANMGGQGVFTKNLELHLINGDIDMAVHSAKDLPSRENPVLQIAAIPPRGYSEDVLISRSDNTLDRLPPKSRVGTSSPRRKAMILYARPDLEISDLRGNIETRLRKLDDGSLDAIVLARAGLHRPGMADRITQILEPHRFVPAAGQGALAVQIRRGDSAPEKIACAIDDPPSRRAYAIEKKVLEILSAGCHSAIGVYARPKEEFFTVTIAAVHPRKRQMILIEESTSADMQDSVFLEILSRRFDECGLKSMLESSS